MKEKYNLDLGIEVLGLSKRTYNALVNANLTTLNSLVGMFWRRLIRIKGFGYSSIQELKEKLPKFGLVLNGCCICTEEKEEVVTEMSRLYNIIDFKGCNELIGKERYLIEYTGLSVSELELLGPNDIIESYSKMHKKARQCYAGVPELFISDVLNAGFVIDEKTSKFVRPLCKEVVVLEDGIDETIEIENVFEEERNKCLATENEEIRKRISRKQLLIDECNQLLEEQRRLLDLERETDRRLEDVLNKFRKINEELAYVRKR